LESGIDFGVAGSVPHRVGRINSDTELDKRELVRNPGVGRLERDLWSPPESGHQAEGWACPFRAKRRRQSACRKGSETRELRADANAINAVTEP
jgi:hypothetical protein